MFQSLPQVLGRGLQISCRRRTRRMLKSRLASFDVRQQLPAISITMRAVLRQSTAYNRGQYRIQSLNRRRLFQDCQQHRRHVVALEGMLAGQHLIEHHAKGPYICPSIERFIPDLLR